MLVDMLAARGRGAAFQRRRRERAWTTSTASSAGTCAGTSLRELEKVLQRRGVRLSLLDPDKLAAQVVAQHADVKARQLI